MGRLLGSDGSASIEMCGSEMIGEVEWAYREEEA